MENKLYLVNINSESNEFLKKILVEELSKGYSDFLKILVFFSKFQSYQWTIRLTFFTLQYTASTFISN